MEKRIRISILLMLLGVLTVSLTRSTGTVGSAQGRFPSGKWSFSAHPFTGAGFESRPVVVTSVKTEFKTLSVTAVRVRNISSKPVIAVRFGWYLSDEKSGKKILKHGETLTTAVDRGLAIGEAKTIALPIVSFNDIYKPLVRNKQLEGDFRVDVAVIDVVFDDQSRWTPKKKVSIRKDVGNGAVMVEVGLGDGIKPLRVTPLEPAPACARQKCKFLEGPPDSYTCESSSNEEYCTNCFTSCCNTLCLDPTPACDCN